MTTARGLVPSNTTPFERAEAETSHRLLKSDTAAVRREREPTTCDAAFVPYLGWERSVHFWTGNPVIDRVSIATAFTDHLAYGTPHALEHEISLDIGYTVYVKDFFAAGVAWPYFKVEVPVFDDAAPVPAYVLIYASALKRKNVRDFPIVEYVAAEKGCFYIGAGLSVDMTVYVLPFDPTIRIFVPVSYGAALSVIATYSLGPFK